MAHLAANPGAQTKPNSGVPLVAVLLTWFLPGAGHLYLGRWRMGLLAMVFLEALYWIGLRLSGGMTFEFVDPELRGPAAILLTPEMGNLGMLLWQYKQHPFASMPGTPSVFPLWMHWGSLLAALSGLLNMCLMVDAHWRAGAGSRILGTSPAFQVLAGGLMPGAGHLWQGRLRRGLVMGSLLLGLFLLGSYLSEGSNLSRERHFYYWTGQLFIGLPTLLAEFAAGHAPITGVIPEVDLGLFYACLAGLLNLLLLIDVYGFQAARLTSASESLSDSAFPAAGQAPSAVRTKEKYMVGTPSAGSVPNAPSRSNLP